MADKNLAFKNRWVKHLVQVLSDRFDTYPLMTPLPFTDMSSRIPLVYRLNQDEYTKMYSALSVGAELVFPEESHELMYIFEVPDEYEAEEDTCLDFETADASIIDFEPQDPHTEPDTTPPGYLLPPFWVVGGLVPEFLPEWFAELITDIIEQFTGYEDDDVLCTVGSLPIGIDFDEIIAVLEGGLPRFTINVEGSGQLELHLLSVPLGGRLLVSIDVEFDPIDIITGIFDDGFNLIELERDYSSIPPEFDVTHVEEIILEGSGTHTIHCTFLPVLDFDAFPIKFGGGIRKIVWCPDNIPDEPCEECPEPTIEELLADEAFFQDEYLPATFGTTYTNTQTRNDALETAYDSTPQSIGSEIPTGLPDDEEKNALCAALLRFVRLYCSEKLCIIQSRNFFEVAWDSIGDAAESFYDSTLDQMLGNWSDNLFGCIVDVETALAVLVDESAMEDLACFLLDELDDGAISESAFGTAITAATTSMSGNAQDIACVMAEDYSVVVALNFFQAYNTVLLQQQSGNIPDCPCITQAYRLWRFNFATQGLTGWTIDWTGSVPLGVAASGYVTSYNTAGGEYNTNLNIRRAINPAHRIKGARLQYQRDAGGSLAMRYRPTPNSNTGAVNPSIANGLVIGSLEWACQNIPLTPTGYITGHKEFLIAQSHGGSTPPGINRIYQLEILYLEGFAPSDSIPWSDADLCT